SQPGGVEQHETQEVGPGGGVADASIERVGFVLSEAQDVRFGFDAGELSEPAGDAGREQNYAEPGGDARVESTLEQIESQRAGRDEEYEDPNGPVRQAIVRFVAFAKSRGAVDTKLSAWGGHTTVIASPVN